jgi:hypothetical protein
MRFTPRKLRFGPGPVDDDDLDDQALPTPRLVRLKARRTAGIAEAQRVLEHMPGPGEALHVVCSSRMDLMDVLDCLLQRFGFCASMHVTTLGFSLRNLRHLLRWFDSGAIGEIWLLSSLFHKHHNGELFAEAATEFTRHRQHCAACASHCKVCVLDFAPVVAGMMSLEGSANLAASGSVREQFALVRDAALALWQSGWIRELVNTHENTATTTR